MNAFTKNSASPNIQYNSMIHNVFYHFTNLNFHCAPNRTVMNYNEPLFFFRSEAEPERNFYRWTKQKQEGKK